MAIISFFVRKRAAFLPVCCKKLPKAYIFSIEKGLLTDVSSPSSGKNPGFLLFGRKPGSDILTSLTDCPQLDVSGDGFGVDLADILTAGDKAVCDAVPADGFEIQLIPAAALRKREAEISADAVEVDLIRRCITVDACFA